MLNPPAGRLDKLVVALLAGIEAGPPAKTVPAAWAVRVREDALATSVTEKPNTVLSRLAAPLSPPCTMRKAPSATAFESACLPVPRQGATARRSCSGKRMVLLVATAAAIFVKGKTT